MGALHQEVVEDEVTREVNEIMGRARAAQTVLSGYTQEQVDALIRAMVWSVSQPGVAEKISKFAVEETELGNFEGKYAKIYGKARAALLDIIDDASVGIIEEDKERNIVKIAKPVGVIGALSPTTHPEVTPVVKAIHAVKARNAIIICPHPRAKLTNKMVVDLMREAIEKMGAPADIVQGIITPSVELTKEVMRQCDLVLATGGAAMVQTAYSSGTPAYGVGAGNAVITVDDTADLKEAAEKIRISKVADLAASCSSDNAVIAFDSVHDELLEELIAQGGYMAQPGEYEKIASVLWNDGVLNNQLILSTPQKIGAFAGIEIPEDRTFIIVPETGTGAEHPFSGEKLSIVLAFYKVSNMDEAITLTNDIQGYQGKGHSCGIYSHNDDHIMRLAQETYTSRVMVNQPQSASNAGGLHNGMRQTSSLGCGTWGGSITNENIYWRHLVNITWVSRNLDQPKTIPSDEELFGDVIQKLAD